MLNAADRTEEMEGCSRSGTPGRPISGEFKDNVMNAGSPPPGWYPDNLKPGRLRWWDGNAWTQHTNQDAPQTEVAETRAAETVAVASPDARLETNPPLEASGQDFSSTFEAYGATVVLRSDSLVVRASNMASRGALGASERLIPVGDIVALATKAPTALVNGTLSIVTDQGKTVVHFRRKQAPALDSLFNGVAAAAPEALVGAAADAAVASAALAKGGGRTVEEAQAAGEERRASAIEAAEYVRTYQGLSATEAQQHGFILAKGERLYGLIEGAQLIEVKHAPGQFTSRSTSTRVRVMKGVSIGVGGSRGHYVPGPEGPTSIDVGHAAITDKRILFAGPRQSREWAFSKLTGIQHSTAGSWTALSVSNRQTTSGLGYDDDVSEAVRFRISLALAEYQGGREELAQSLAPRPIEDSGP